MKALVLALVAMLLPATASAATLKLFYLSGEATLPYIGFNDGRLHTRNTGVLGIDLDHHGPLAGRTLSHAADPYDPSPTGVSVEFRFGIPADPGFHTYTLSFDEDARLASWQIWSEWWAPGWHTDIYTTSSGEGAWPPRGDVWTMGFFDDVFEVFRAPAGTWYRSEQAYVEAARAAGVEPIPLPASIWLVLAGAAAIGGLTRGRRRAPA